MFLPLHDDTPLRVIRFQFVTVFIIALNTGVFLFTGAFSSDAILANMQTSYGLTPVDLLHAQSGHAAIPEPLTLITYLFIHGGWMHLIGNMLFMWVFADNIEDAFGYVGFAIFYLLCGVVGGLTHVLMTSASHSPLIGASGAVSGILASYLILYPRARVWVLLFLRIPVPLPAIWVLGGWFLLQVYSLAAARPGEDTAWWAHIGGFVTGLLITIFLRQYLFLPPNRRI